MKALHLVVLLFLVAITQCQVNGTWGGWPSYGDCSVTCGGGYQATNRSCDNPHPQNGGEECLLSDGSGLRGTMETKTRVCNTQGCPVNGSWGMWPQTFEPCSVTCGGGWKARMRYCDNPVPRNGGLQCPLNDGSGNRGANETESRVCENQVCPASLSMECHESYVKGVWRSDLFATSNVTIMLNDPSCTDYHKNSTHVWMTIHFSQCGSIISELGGFIVQENTAKVTIIYNYRNFVERRFTHSYNMRCTFDRSLNVSSATIFETRNRSEVVYNHTGITNLSVTMDIYETSSYLRAVTGAYSVTSFQPIFLGIKEVNNNANFKFIVHQCFATATSTGDGVKYVFFDMKCPVDPTFKMTASSNDHFNFRIDAFNFIQVRGTVYIHCKLYVCKVGTNSSNCNQDCHVRQRRAVAENNGPKDGPVGVISVKSNAITYRKQALCRDLTCPSHSRCKELYPAVCRCDIGYVRDWKSRNCRKDSVLGVNGLHFDMKFIDTYSNVTSSDFLLLATGIEKELTDLLQKEDENIVGIKVVRARRGSVIVDILILRANEVSEEEAFKTFVDVVTTKTVGTRHFHGKIKKEITPVLVLHVADGSGMNYYALILVPVLFVIWVTLLVVYLKTRRTRHVKEAHTVVEVVEPQFEMGKSPCNGVDEL